MPGGYPAPRGAVKPVRSAPTNHGLLQPGAAWGRAKGRRDRTYGRPRGGWHHVLLGVGTLLHAIGGAGCSVETGVVEWAWSFVDQNGSAIYPAGIFDFGRRSACGLPGRVSQAQPPSETTYDLGVELTVCDPTCVEGCSDPDCQVVAPLEFDCSVARGSNPAIPSDEAPYRFALEPVISLPDGQQCRGLEGCIASPGPRDRVVKPGLVTDLQVFQLVLRVDQDAPTSGPDATGALDLDACGCPEP